MPWDLTGNRGIQPTTNFLGTRDNQPLAIRTNNVERMRVTPTGDVGIGTTTPDAKLAIHKDEGNGQFGSRPAQIRIHGHTNPNNKLELGYDTVGNFAVIGAVTEMVAWRNIILANNGGNVGIGTTNPGSKLEVRGHLRTSGQLSFTDPNGIHYPDNWIGMAQNIEGSTRWLHIGGITDGGVRRLTLWADRTFFQGNVGIGTTNPAAKLAVIGDVEVTGDIRLLGADCAEEFDVSSAEQIEPGTVMVIDEEGVLRESSRAYDKRVAGVVSGGGDYRAGLLLDRQESKANRMPVALVGKVACKVEARESPIEVGDLLTTAATPGHAMKAEDLSKAPGAVIGKALQRLTEGQGLIGVLVSLQ
jgi:hypothetical protein